MGRLAEAIEQGADQSVDLGRSLQIEHATQQEDGLVPFGVVDHRVLAQESPVAVGIGTAGQGLGGQVFLEGQVPEFELIAAAHQDAAVDLFLREECLGAADARPALRITEGRGDLLRGPAAGDLDLPSRGVALHGERQLGQELAAALGLGAAGTLLARLDQPGDDGFIELGTLLGQVLVVPVHDGERGKHDGVAREQTDLTAGAERGGQRPVMGLRPVRAIAEQGVGPAGEEAVDGRGVQGIDVHVGKARDDHVVAIGRGAAGDDQGTIRIGAGYRLDQTDDPFALQAIGRLVQAVEQHHGLTAAQPAPKILRREVLARVRGLCRQKVREPVRAVGQDRAGVLFLGVRDELEPVGDGAAIGNRVPLALSSM
jgi:hypothetical protein